MSLLEQDTPHYPTRAERLADLWVHAIALGAGAAGGVALLALAFGFGQTAQAVAYAIYVSCLLLMFGCSAAYNFSQGAWKALLRRFDHAGIFLMIAGTYTPFTTQALKGGWAIGMTAAVWAVALAGAFGKLLLPGVSKRLWVVLYLALGWVVLIAIKPLAAELSMLALILLAAGGVLYSTGVIFYLRERLKFRRAIWHGFVAAAAAAHFAAVVVGILIPNL